MLAFSGWLLFSWGKTADSDSALHFWVLKATGLIMALSAASGLSTLSLLAYAGNLPLGAGGVLGEVVGNGFVAIFGTAGSSLLLLAVLLTGVTLFTGLSWLMVIDRLGGFVILVVTLVSRWLREFKEKLAANRTKQQREDNFNEQNEKLQLRSKVRVEPTIQTTEVSKREEKERQVPLFETVEEGVMPALALLEQAEASKGGYSEEVLQALSRQVELKLKDFGVTVQVVEV